MKIGKITCFFIFFLMFLFAGCGVKVEKVESQRHIFLPGYFYPTKPFWDEILSHSSSDIPIVVLNPCGGPLDCSYEYKSDLNYLSLIDALIERGINPIGYVYTDYGYRDIDDVKTDIDNWIELYHNIGGFFIDEVSNMDEDLEYYRDLVAYINLKEEETGKRLIVVLNPGSKPTEDYYDIADFIVIYEHDISRYNENSCYSIHSEKSVCIVYGATETDMEKIVRESNTDFFYITDDSYSLPYDTLPSYFDREIELLK